MRLRNQPIDFVFDQSLRVRLYPDDGVARLTYYFGYHEPALFQFFNGFLRPGMTVFDIGANIGCYSLFAAKRIGAAGRVYCFEPLRQTFLRLADNIACNGLTNIQPEHLAIGDFCGKLRLIREKDSSKSYTQDVDVRQRSPDDTQDEYCDAVTLDSFLAMHRIGRIDYLKIDVEGFEARVIAGATKALTEMVPGIIQMELIDELQVRGSGSAHTVRQTLSALGWRCFRLDDALNRLLPYADTEQAAGNVFLIHQSRLDEHRGFIA